MIKGLLLCNWFYEWQIKLPIKDHILQWSACIAERLVLPTSDHRVLGSNTTRGDILSTPKPPRSKQRFIAQSLSCPPFHCPDMTEILLKGERDVKQHPSYTTKVHQCKMLPGLALGPKIWVLFYAEFSLGFWKLEFKNPILWKRVAKLHTNVGIYVPYTHTHEF